VEIERNHIMMAQIVPPQPTMTASQALTGLGLPVLTPQQGAGWLGDSNDKFDDALRDLWG
jgi:hypothetical protein